MNKREFFMEVREELFRRSGFTCQIFPIVEKENGKKAQVIVYFLEWRDSDRIKTTRFVLDREEQIDKKLFFDMVKKGKVSPADMSLLRSMVEETFPEIHYQNYENDDFDRERAFTHLFYSLCERGLAERLYKANLVNIALLVAKHAVPDVDYNANTLNKCIRSIPQQLLYTLNGAGCLHYLLDENDAIESCIRTYEMFHSYGFFKEPLTDTQFFYLREVEAGKFPAFSRHVFNEVSGYCQGYNILEFEKYYKLKKRLVDNGIRVSAKSPHVEDLCDANAIYEAALKVLEQKSEEYGKLEQRKEECEKYSYSDGIFSVIFSTDMKDFVQESVWQENCLVTNGFLRNHAEGKTSVLFIRKCERPEQTYLTMEVCDGEIVQVLGRKNRFLRKQELEFLMKYAAVKGFVFEPFSLLEDCAERFHVTISDDLEAFYENIDSKRWKGFCESQKELAELLY